MCSGDPASPNCTTILSPPSKSNPPLPIIHGNRFQASSTTSLQLQSGAKKGGRSRRLFFGPKKKDSNEQDNKEENKVGRGVYMNWMTISKKWTTLSTSARYLLAALPSSSVPHRCTPQATTKHRKVGLSLLNLVNKSRIYVRLLMRVTRDEWEQCAAT
ncbi:hypothetical protein BDQ17DRAFT_235004 [Cyathus striatus]|nr:hypothetical protein BDQ17DRAFT_235004 [Cyathus striatus]